MRKMLGIDVSKHNGVIDWKKVAATDVDFAIIRAGYGYTYVDPRFKYNIENAIANGIKVGVYWFVYALSVDEAIKNADKFHSVIAPYAKNITMKVWCDFEYDSDNYANKNGIAFSKESRTAIVKAFCERLKELGYDVGVYANRDYLRYKFEDLSEYPLWYALYNSTKDRECLMWQHTSKGKVDGITGNVDMNYLYTDEIEYYNSPEFTLVESLKKIGVDSSFKHRAKIAAANNIQNYTGTAEQNLLMLQLLNEGKLIVA